MPTGYTADISKGMSFNDYAMGCARAFGALVLMRDEAKDAQIPEKIEPSDYHEKALKTAKARLTKLEGMSLDDANFQSTSDWDRAEESRLNRLSENKKLRVKYELMLRRAKEYISPTPDHDSFREFMISQIEESIKWDCSESYYENPEEMLSGEDWLNKEKVAEEKNIHYHTKNNNEEIERTNDRNSWLNSLRNSLK